MATHINRLWHSAETIRWGIEDIIGGTKRLDFSNAQAWLRRKLETN
jgi:hypothetical protein